MKLNNIKVNLIFLSFLIIINPSYCLQIQHEYDVQKQINNNQKLFLIDSQIKNIQNLQYLNQKLMSSSLRSKISKEGKEKDKQKQKQQQQMFNKLKIRKMNEIKIDVTETLKLLQQTKQNYKQKVDSNNIQTSLNTPSEYAKTILLQNLKYTSTLGIPAKRFQGQLNHFNFLLINLFDKYFYTLDGENALTIDKTNQASYNRNIGETSTYLNNLNEKQILISSVRNEHFYIAKYINNPTKTSSMTQSEQQSPCPYIKISQIQVKSNQVQQSINPQHKNFIVQSKDYCRSPVTEYKYFFTHISLTTRRNYYIFISKRQIHFYFYNQFDEQMVLDHNRTVSLEKVFSPEDEIQKKIDKKQKGQQPHNNKQPQQIQKVIKLNTHLVILTSRNHLFSVNLINLLSNKKRQNLYIYETFSNVNLQEIWDLKYNDIDYRYFYSITNKGIYRYRIQNYQIIRKYSVPEQIYNYKFFATDTNSNDKLFDVFILENYILMNRNYNLALENQNKPFQNQGQSKFFGMHIGNPTEVFTLQLPFIHQFKCSAKHKQILLHKNKNSNYVISLVCFFRQKQLPSSHISQTNKRKSKLPSYIVFQNLILQTSNEGASSHSNNSSPDQQLNLIDFTKFRLPLIVFSLGIIFFVTMRKSNKKNPEKELEEQRVNKKFQQQIMEKIKRERQRIQFNKAGTNRQIKKQN